MNTAVAIFIQYAGAQSVSLYVIPHNVYIVKLHVHIMKNGFESVSKVYERLKSVSF